MRETLVNAIGFQAVWLCSVGGAAHGLVWPGPLAATLFGLAVLGFGGRRREDLRMLAIALPLGIALDSALLAAGLLRYAEPWPWPGLAPAWIWSLWVGFALTVNHSLSGLKRRPWLAAGLGAVGGPLAYASAARGFQAIEILASPTLLAAVLAVTWAILPPLLFRLDRRAGATSSGVIPT